MGVDYGVASDAVGVFFSKCEFLIKTALENLDPFQDS